MTNNFAAAMRRAFASTRAQNLAEATQIIQAALAGNGASGASSIALDPPSLPLKRPPSRGLIDPSAQITAFETEPAPQAPRNARGEAGSLLPRPRRPLGEVIEALRKARLPGEAFGRLPGMKRPSAPPPIPEGAQFLTRSFTCSAGTRGYKLYIPASAVQHPRGLLLMLHGCTQDPDDFATGTNMNAIAEKHGLLVAYPAQEASDNPSSCWNWFDPADQMRDAGEPAILAGMTRAIMAEYGLARQQVFVAGLSAGGAMAAVMGATYPDVFAAVGIHSGLAYGSAHDVVSAFSAMRGERGLPARTGSRLPTNPDARVRTIVFQGSADRTVHPSNAERIIAAVSPDGLQSPSREQGRSPGGRSYTRTVSVDAAGHEAVEYWLVEGAGHAWSGGNADGSYTDPQGPDASAEMMRFFLEQPAPRPTH